MEESSPPCVPTMLRTTRDPCFRVVLRVFRCRRIAWLSSCCRHLDVAAVLVMLKPSLQGMKSKFLLCRALHFASHQVMHSISLN